MKMLVFLCGVVMACSFAEAAPQTCAELEAWKQRKIQQDTQEKIQHHKDMRVLRKKALKDVDEQDELWLKEHGEWATQMEKTYEMRKTALGCKDDHKKI